MKSATINDFEVMPHGILQVRIAKDNDTSAATSKWHRVTFAPIDDLDTAISQVNADLNAMGYDAIPTSGWDSIRSAAQTAWTDEVVAAYRRIIGDPQD